MYARTSLCLLLLATGNSVSAAPLFSVSFDKGLAADVASGGAEPAVTGKPQLVAGKTGKALRIGRPDESLFYPLEGNVDPAKGTVSMWVKPIGFSPSATPEVKWDGFDLFRVTTRTDEIRLALTRSNQPDNQRCYLFIQTAPVQPDGLGGGPKRVRAWGRLTDHPSRVVVPWAEGEFRHVAATWDFGSGVVEVYLDGKCLKANRDDLLRKKIGSELPKYFQAGPCNGILYDKSEAAKRKILVLDEIKIFGRRLTASEIAGLAAETTAETYDRERDYRLPLITIPAVHQPPAIDGRLSKGEWDAAAGVGGFINIGTVKGSGYLADDDVFARVMFDSTSLYALFVSPLAEMPPQFAGAGDHYAAGLDMIEWWIGPDIEKGEFFQFIGAPSGAIYDSKNNSKRWDGRWEFGNGLSKGRWIAEVRVAFEDLGVAPPKIGDEWRMNFCRYYPHEKRATCWSDTVTRYDVVSRHGHARFDDISVAIVTDVTEMLQGRIGWRCELANPTDRDIHVELDVQGRLKPIYQTDGKEGDGQTTQAEGDLFMEIHTVKLSPGGRRVVSIEDSFQKRGTRFYSLAAFSLPGRTPICQQLVPISPQAGQLLFVKAAALYESEKVIAEVEAGPLRAQREGRLTLRVELRRGEVIAAEEQVVLTSDQHVIELTAPTWQAGHYTVQVQALDGRTVVANASARLHLAERPAWWGNSIGKADRVQPPWTPVQAAQDGVRMWGREYALGQNGLPRQVTTQSAPVLAEPVALVLDGDERVRDAALTPVSSGDTGALYSSAGSLGSYRLTGEAEVTYDGVIDYNFTLAPRRAGASVRSLWIEMPIRGEAAKYLVRRAEGQGLNQGVTLPVQRSMRVPFNHSLWIGDLRRGLHWYTDTDEGWTAPREKSVELVVTPHQVALRIHVLAAGPAEPLRLRFGILATPIRPLRPGWRTMRLGGNPKFWANSNYQLYDTAKLALLGRCPLDKKPDGTHYVPRKDREWLDGVIDLAHQSGAKFTLYTSAHGLAERANANVYQTYHTEWDMLPRGSYNTGWRRFFLVCPCSRHVDYFMWNLDRMLKAGKLDAVYFDQAAPGLCKNALHGCGYQDGALRRPTQTIRAQRELYRRARQVFLDNGLEPMVIGHTSTQVIPACYTHLDALLNGEQFTGCLVDNDHIKSIDEPMLLTQWGARLMGIPPIFLPEIFWQRLKRERWNWRQLWLEQLRSPASSRATRNLMALLLPNDIIYYGGLMDVRLGQRIWTIWDRLGDAKFASHRDSGLVTAPAPPQIQAGLYVRPVGEAILAIGNLDEKPAAVTVRIAPGFLSLEGKSIHDLLDNRSAVVMGQEISVDVSGKDLRLLALRE